MRAFLFGVCVFDLKAGSPSVESFTLLKPTLPLLERDDLLTQTVHVLWTSCCYSESNTVLSASCSALTFKSVSVWLIDWLPDLRCNIQHWRGMKTLQLQHQHQPPRPCWGSVVIYSIRATTLFFSPSAHFANTDRHLKEPLIRLYLLFAGFPHRTEGIF